eukprot:scaffold277_cov261-Pinguiococcus_pyrenoidosus.AAC.11
MASCKCIEERSLSCARHPLPPTDSILPHRALRLGGLGHPCVQTVTQMLMQNIVAAAAIQLFGVFNHVALRYSVLPRRSKSSGSVPRLSWSSSSSVRRSRTQGAWLHHTRHSRFDCAKLPFGSFPVVKYSRTPVVRSRYGQPLVLTVPVFDRLEGKER